LTYIVAALQQGSAHIFREFFVISVFDFDACWTAIARFNQNRKKLAPVDIAKAWQTRAVIFERCRKDADIIEPVFVNLYIFDVYMEKPVFVTL